MKYLGVGVGRMRKRENKKPQESRSHVSWIVSCSTNILFKLGQTSITMLCQFLLYSVHTYIPSVLDSPFRYSPISCLQVTTEYQTELPVLHSWFPLASYLVHGGVYMSVLISQFIPPPFPPSMSARLFSTSASLFLPCKQVHLCHFPRFHIYALMYNICFVDRRLGCFHVLATMLAPQ